MILKKTIVALSLGLGLLAGAHAVVDTTNNLDIDIGTVGAPKTFTQVIQKAVGSFSDTWSFSIGQNTFAGGSVSNLSINVDGLGNLFNITGLGAKLYDGNNTLIDDLSDNSGSTAGLKVGSGLFTPGDYYFNVTGTANGMFGGQYVFAVSTLPVPEPETFAMLLAGLGVMGAIARRRRKTEV